jgi:hypothetical protein
VYRRLECAWSEKQGLGELVDGACVRACFEALADVLGSVDVYSVVLS